MTVPDPAQHPLDVLDSIAADVLSDTEAAEQFLANDFAATVNRLAGRQVMTPSDLLTLARIPDPCPSCDPAPCSCVIEIPPEAMHPFGEVFGDKDDPDETTA